MWVLIYIAVVWSGITTSSIEFNSEELCLTAAQAVEQKFTDAAEEARNEGWPNYYRKIITTCVQKE